MSAMSEPNPDYVPPWEYADFKPGDRCLDGMDHHIWERGGLDVIERRGRQVMVAVRDCHMCRRRRYVKP